MLDALIGQFLGRYQIVQLLGEGGVGAVFKARDTALQRDVVVKVMHPQLTHQANFQERFLQEARTAARLDHPGIVRVFDFGQAQSLLYIVMEFIPGQNLRRKLDDLKAASQLLPLPEASQLARHISLAISYAHRQGVLHRDIKPDNIMLKPEPAEGLPYRPILTDLGLAKLLEGGPLPLDGMSMRTPSYMSPEQTLGEPTDARSDVYSLGILLYELAAGRLPFAISTLTEAIRCHTKELPPPPRSFRPELPIAVEQVILTALQKDPAQRFPSAAALAEALLAGTSRLAQGAGQATVIQASHLPAYEEPPAARRVAISMPTEFEVEPGGSTAVTVTIANRGPVPDRLQLSFVDLPAGWAPEPPPVIRLLPGAEQRVTLTVQPPRSPESRAGSHPFTVRAESLDTPAQSAEAQGCLVINPYIQFAGELKPQTVRAGQAAQVRVENQGNAPQSFVVSWQDRNGELTFEPPQTRLTVPEGQVGVAKFRATPRSRRWFGSGKAHTFSSRVAVPGVEAQSQTGQVISGGLIPLWLLPVAGISLLVLCVVLFTLVAKPPIIQNVTVDPPNPPAGQPFTIRWVVQNAQSIELRPLVDGLDPRTGEYTFRNGLPSATNLTFIARNPFGSKVKLMHIGVIGSATVSPAIPSASPTPAGTTPTGPTPTGTASPTPNATPTATGTPGPCQPTAARFAAAHKQWSEQLGCANSPAGETFMASQSLEHGVMFWRQDSREIYVLQGNSWQRFSDNWQEGQPESDPALVPPEGRQQPVRGFGKVWREQLGGAGAGIGWAREKEQGYTGKWQDFAHGLLLTGPDERIYALFDDGHWQSK